MTDQLLRVRDVARITGIAADTLYAWRNRGVGPESFKLRGVVVYRESVVTAWIGEQAAAAKAPQSITRRTA